jgi:selenocysteine lyase/cysteine desulfurase
VPTDAYEAELSDRTAMVCTAHAYSFTGGLSDPAALADAVHDRGGYCFLDAYQSVGVVPVDVHDLGVDFLTAGTLKFLLGGPGLAFLYVSDRVVEALEPANLGWFGVDDVFGFETEDPQYAPGARRFELGTPPATLAYQAEAGMSLVDEVGVERVRERVRRLTARLIDGAEGRGFQVRTPRADEHRGGVVNVQCEVPEETADAMLDAGFNVSTRAGGVRFSPHFYNTDAELERALDALAEHGTPVERSFV